MFGNRDGSVTEVVRSTLRTLGRGGRRRFTHSSLARRLTQENIPLQIHESLHEELYFCEEISIPCQSSDPFVSLSKACLRRYLAV